MPSFCIPYEDILPFLTPEVKALLGPMREKCDKKPTTKK
jgi:hypothetical protein